MNITCLGAGAWGFCLASLLASKGHRVILWTRKKELAQLLNDQQQHPKLPHFQNKEKLHCTTDLSEALQSADLIVESITSQSIRTVFETIHKMYSLKCPLVITSKGIEKDTCLLIPEILIEIFGSSSEKWIGCLSGPSLAEEVVKNIPTTVICSAYDVVVMKLIQTVFNTAFFHVYCNTDILGVCLGGAIKNIIAIAAGLSDGLGFGNNTKASLITFGLQEMCALAQTKGAQSITMSGLAGLGDLCVTCLSNLSRNYKFGYLIAQGMSPQQAQLKIGMVVEGSYSCISALQLAQHCNLKLPLLHTVHNIVHQNKPPLDAMKEWLQTLAQ